MGLEDISATQQRAQTKQKIQLAMQEACSDLSRRFAATWPAIQETVESSPELQNIDCSWHASSTPKFLGYLHLPNVGYAFYLIELTWKIMVDDLLDITLSMEESGKLHRYIHTTQIQSPVIPFKLCLDKVLLERYQNLRRLHASRGYDAGIRLADFCFYWRGDHDTKRITSAIEAILAGEIPADDFRMNRKKEGCFVATAVYGDSAPEVKALRTFRDECLLRIPFGKFLVALYYVTSPRVAGLISRSCFLRAIVRFALGPLVGALRVVFPSVRRQQQHIQQ